MLESAYQNKIIKRLEHTFPECIIFKNDPIYRQGVPDLIVLYLDRWIALEVKTSSTAEHQPNQDYYVERLNSMSYAAFIFPENENEVFHAIQYTFDAPRPTRLLKSK